MNKVKVYRAGLLTPPVERGVEKESYALADEFAGDRQGRMTALFAVPTLAAVTRWVRGNAFARKDTKVHELTIDADKVFIYRVSDWETASWTMAPVGSEKWTEVNGAYWANGETLTAHLERYADGYADNDERDDFEILIPADAVISVRPVSGKRILDSMDDADYTKREVADILKKQARDARWERQRARAAA